MLAFLGCTQITQYELNLATTAMDEPFIQLQSSA